MRGRLKMTPADRYTGRVGESLTSSTLTDAFGRGLCRYVGNGDEILKHCTDAICDGTNDRIFTVTVPVSIDAVTLGGAFVIRTYILLSSITSFVTISRTRQVACIGQLSCVCSVPGDSFYAITVRIHS